jgi:hypothetical protein
MRQWDQVVVDPITSVITITSITRVFSLALTFSTQPILDPLNTLTEITLHRIPFLLPKLTPLMHRPCPQTIALALPDIEPQPTMKSDQRDSNKSADLSPTPPRRSLRLRGKLAQTTPARIDSFLRGPNSKATASRKAKKTLLPFQLHEQEHQRSTDQALALLHATGVDLEPNLV